MNNWPILILFSLVITHFTTREELPDENLLRRKRFIKERNKMELALKSSTNKKHFISDSKCEYQIKLYQEETLFLLAFKIYGDYKHWRGIWKNNPKLQSIGNIIPKGTELNCPCPSKPFVYKGQSGLYIVKQGDTLSSIALKIYGDKKKWTSIFQFNKRKIKTPNLIKPGLKLTIHDTVRPLSS